MTDEVDYSKEDGCFDKLLGRWEWCDDEGKSHRDGDLPAHIYTDKTWVKYYGGLTWWHHGRNHRLTGYASIFPAINVAEWWINGEKYDTKEKFVEARDAYCEKHNIPIPESDIGA